MNTVTLKSDGDSNRVILLKKPKKNCIRFFDGEASVLW